MHRDRTPRTDLPDKLVAERDEIRETLGTKWWMALITAMGNWLFDYLALLAALTAVGSRPGHRSSCWPTSRPPSWT